jgi:type III pantothenate kinase
MQLYVDIGNQRIKWATGLQLTEWFQSRDEELVVRALTAQSMEYQPGCINEVLDDLFTPLATPDSIDVASVASQPVGRAVQAYCVRQWNIEANFAVSGPHFNGMTNGYDEPGKLGVDRWLGMIGGRAHIPGRNLLVIDAGTAVTVDYIGKDGIYAGGIIFPGVSTMADSLNISTGQIRVDSGIGPGITLQMQNTSTTGAVINGVIYGVLSSIEHAIDYFWGLEGKNFETIITGGDAELILDQSGKKMHLLPQLVLSGLMIFSGETLP